MGKNPALCIPEQKDSSFCCMNKSEQELQKVKAFCSNVLLQRRDYLFFCVLGLLFPTEVLAAQHLVKTNIYPGRFEKRVLSQQILKLSYNKLPKRDKQQHERIRGAAAFSEVCWTVSGLCWSWTIFRS